MKGFILTYSLMMGLLLYSLGIGSAGSKADGSSNFESTHYDCSEEFFCFYDSPYINSHDFGQDQVVYFINSNNPVHYPLVTQNREQSIALSQKSYRTHKGYATNLKI